jgi:hypothetical protein
VASLAVPGLEQVEAELEEVSTEHWEVNERLSSAKARHAELAKHRRLLSEGGRLFTSAVADALRLLGFVVTSDPGDPLVIQDEGTTAFVETESERGQVVEWPYVRLQRRLEEHLLKEGVQRKGIAVVNGYRQNEPGAREPQFTGALRIACENYRYTLISAETLFALVQRALDGADDAALTGIRRRIRSAAGLIETSAALGESEEPRESGPIF